ncbi:hypothetical protein [Marinomonas aquiplantarum]|uniref:Uncharacterized protein n=1 Tax=Marinomonas aquiplantarum TaxID=491951 RepID=A0A366CX58_9GAMM|nr:hypothetical protein [Marinomonas aquiplantarum]RBO82195.1 hypothetical protein DFP76_10623 [Marinomonas aquiplantarum]
MPKDSGTYNKLDTKSVRNDVTKSVTYLKNKLPSLVSHPLNVIFLGEEHRNQVDVGVAQQILSHPPVLHEGETRVIFERGLEYPIANGMDEREDRMDPGLTHKARSKLIAGMIQDAFDEHDKNLVYVACGMNHAVEIFDALNKTMLTNFGFIVKPSSTD